MAPIRFVQIHVKINKIADYIKLLIFENRSKYPLLSPLAKAYLSIPATSVPSERVFSTAGDIVTAQRSQLLPEIVDMLIFLKKNIYLRLFCVVNVSLFHA